MVCENPFLQSEMYANVRSKVHSVATLSVKTSNASVFDVPLIVENEIYVLGRIDYCEEAHSSLP